MKNKIIFGALLFLLPLSALATSGACSGHGGVSCSAGPDRDGSVICVDGWTNSSVSYSSMVKCQGYAQPQAVQTKTVEPTDEPTPKPTSVAPVKTVAPAKVPTATPTITPTTTVQAPVESAPQPQIIEIPQKPAKKSFWSRVLSWF